MAPLVLAWAQWAAPAWAGDLISQRAYWSDPQGQAPLAQAREQAFEPFKGAINRGFTSAATWVQLTLEPPEVAGQDRFIFLRVQPNYLDDVQLYDPADPRPQPLRAGDRVSPRPGEAGVAFESLSHGFVLPVTSEPRVLWLRVRSDNMSLIDLAAHGESQAQVQERRRLLQAWGSLGLMAVLTLFNLAAWALDRNRFHALFLLRTVLLSGLLAIYFGVARQALGAWVAPTVLDHWFNLGVLGTTLLACFFEHRLLSDYGVRPWTRPVRRVTYGLAVGQIVLYLCGWRLEALSCNAVVTLAMVVSFVAVALWGLRFPLPVHGDSTGGLHRGFLLAYHVFLLLSHPFFQGPLLGLLDDSPTVVGMLAYYVMSSTVAMTLIVQLRALGLRRQQKRLEMEMALVNERMAQERLRSQEQGDLLAMLMHEVRNPLAVIELAQQQSSGPSQVLVSKNVDLIRGVLDRTLKLDSQLRAGQALQPRSTYLSDCLAQALDETGPGSERIRLLRVADEELDTDPEALLIILVNLLRNALKYSPEDAPVDVSVDRLGDPARLCISVSNPVGPSGRPDPARVFQKYYRADAAKKWPGTGMGLYLVKQLAQRLGGDCLYRSDARQVSFEVCLPAKV